MLTGIRYAANPTREQTETLSQWIGCARVIWNAKCEEDKYLRTFARKYLPINTYAAPDKAYSQYKTELTPWLNDVPSQILRNSATIWHQTYQKFFKKTCGRPVRKKKTGKGYIWVTRELFDLKQIDGRWELFIGTKTNNIGLLNVNWHKKPRTDQLPNSIWVRVANGRWTVSFSYDDGHLQPESNTADHLAWLKDCTAEQLEDFITPLDRGVARPVQTHDTTYVPKIKAQYKQKGREAYIKRCQRKLARQVKHSNRWKKTKRRIASLHTDTANVRTDFLHQTSRHLVDNAQVIVIEDLKLRNMTKRAKAKLCPDTGKWLRNGAAAKSSLNRSLLGVGLYKLEEFITYKAERQNKPVFKVNPANTSRECAACGYIHPDNRKTQSDFRCQRCLNRDNADRNAALVIKKRAIQLILHSGTELVGARKNVLRSGTDVKPCKTRPAKAGSAAVCPSKKKAAAMPPEALGL